MRIPKPRAPVLNSACGCNPERCDMATTVWKHWKRTAARLADAPAVTDAGTGRFWSYGQLHDMAEARAESMHGLGVRPGHVVVLARENGAAWLADFLGLQALGAVVLPVDPQAAAAETAGTNASARLLVGDSTIPMSGTRRHRNSLCLIKATSGSTGVSKLYAFTDEQMLADGRQIVRGMDLRRADINYAVIPFGHSYGLGNLVFPLIAHGISVVTGRGFFPADILRDLREHRATVFPAVPPLLRALSETGHPGPHSLRKVISAGGKLDPAVRDRFSAKFQVPVHNFYGSTETGGISFTRRIPQPGEPATVGEPLPGVKVTINRNGVVTVSSAAVYTRGNRRREGSHGIVTVSDRGSFNARGELILSGRTDREVKVAGRRLRLADIESAALRVRGVDECFAHALNTEGADSRIGIVAAGRADPVALRQALAAALPPWARPKKTVVVPAMPLTARGKWCRPSLLRLLGEEPGGTDAD